MSTYLLSLVGPFVSSCPVQLVEMDRLGFSYATAAAVPRHSCFSCSLWRQVPGKDGKLAAHGGGVSKDERLFFTLRKDCGAGSPANRTHTVCPPLRPANRLGVIFLTVNCGFCAPLPYVEGDTIMENIVEHSRRHAIIFSETVKLSQSHPEPVRVEQVSMPSLLSFHGSVDRAPLFLPACDDPPRSPRVGEACEEHHVPHLGR